MALSYMHIGIPITEKKEGMTYNEGMKIWMSNPADYDMAIEYLIFEEGNPFPKEVQTQVHVAYKMDDMEPYLAEADKVIFGPVQASETARLAFIIKDGAVIELYEEK